MMCTILPIGLKDPKRGRCWKKYKFRIVRKL
jgi:hypothetical protein